MGSRRDDVQKDEFLKKLPGKEKGNCRKKINKNHVPLVPRSRNTSISSLSSVDQSIAEFLLNEKDFESTLPQEKKLTLGLEKSDYDAFFKVCNAFVKTLKKLNSADDHGKICETLSSIHRLLEEKISYLTMSETKLPESECMSSSSHNLSFKEFLSAVNCPFCSEIQSDKISLVKHLDEDCSPHSNKIFQEKKHLPYSAFQVLPNNTFKCNICEGAIQSDLKHFYVHFNSDFHRKAYASALKKRNYEQSLFCSCCKVLIYCNFTQISFHINHEVHKKKSTQKKRPEYLQSKGIHCVFTESKKFKCLDCPPALAVYTSNIDILKHLEGPVHKTFRKKNAVYSSLMYCEVCLEEVSMYNVIQHFTSSTHKAKEEELKEQNFEACIFCGWIFDSLKELSFHMESKCDEINSARQKTTSVPEKSKTFDKSDEQAKVSSEREIKKLNNVPPTVNTEFSSKNEESKIVNTIGIGRTTERFYITVKNCTKIVELFKYFKKFGDILAIEPQDDRDVVIEFREKSSVDDIMLLRNLIKIDGLKLEVTADRKPCQSDEEVHSTEEDDESHCHKEDCKESKAERECDVLEEHQLEELFKRVSTHLINTTKSSNSPEEEKILRDLILTLKLENCNFVGFSRCGLSFPFESVKMFCSIKDSPNEEAPNYNSRNLTETLLDICCTKLSGANLWETVTLHRDSYFSSVKCIHMETKKACTIITRASALLLTDMLRDCMEECNLVRPFCLIIRFWLSVHELKIVEFEFVIISLLVFFLIREEVVCLPQVKYNHCVLTPFLREELNEFRPSSRSEKPPFGNVKELFQKFLYFLDKFDFDKYAICLPFQYPVPKSVFTQSTFKLLSGIKNPASLLSCHMCIVDPILLVNLASDVKKKHREEFLEIIKASVKCYQIK